ncbi:MAG: isomerizing glutamine--fructose-6-phosphate transaminase, partial [Chloroflexi bacterium]|nr:isomerizing glutamine--fructose-6-phosphate transaminase [Chloroflexota bacterium]
TPYASSAIFLEPGESGVVSPSGFELRSLNGRASTRTLSPVGVNGGVAAKGGYKHFTLKEIHEQPESAMSALHGRISFSQGEAQLDETLLPFTGAEAAALTRVIFLGMGTSVHAGLVGARYVEALARIPASAENAAEFLHRDPVLDRHTLVVGVTQSGETADTLQALHEARIRGARTAAITNVPESEATRAVEHSLLMHAGHEVGVASTKTMVNSMVVMYLAACALGQQRDTLSVESAARCVDEITRLPGLLGAAIEMTEHDAEGIARRYLDARRFLFLGRGLMEPVAREGAYKMKETSYIHAEGMPAAEIKHGPLALIDHETPVVAVAPRNTLYEKMLISMSQVGARGGKVIAVATTGSAETTAYADDVLWVPECPPLLQPMVAVVPLQLFAYRMADLLCNDVDQPRNLAKSVTVE